MPAASPPYRLLLADDHAVFRAGLRGYLDDQPDFEVVAEAARGDEVLTLVRQHRPDLLVLDVQMPGLSGTAVVRALREGGFDTHVLVLSAFEDPAYVEAFARLGATGFVTKSRPPASIVEALREAARGEPVWLVRQPVTSPVFALTARERELLVLLARGLSNEEMAARLNVSDSTVRNGLTTVYHKLGVTGARGAIAWAWRNRLVSHDD